MTTIEVLRFMLNQAERRYQAALSSLGLGAVPEDKTIPALRAAIAQCERFDVLDREHICTLDALTDARLLIARHIERIKTLESALVNALEVIRRPVR